MTDATPRSGNSTVNVRDIMWKTARGRANIVVKLWRDADQDDDFHGRSTSVTSPPPKSSRPSSAPPVGASFVPPSRRRQPCAYHEDRIGEALQRGDLTSLRAAVERAEHDLMRHVGLLREFDADDPYWSAAVGDSTGSAPEEISVRLGCPKEFVCRVRILREEDMRTGNPTSYGTLERKVIKLTNAGWSYRRIAEETGVARSTIGDFLNGKQRVRRTD